MRLKVWKFMDRKPEHWLQKLKEKENGLLALTVTLLLMILVGWRFDYYYDLNDDVLMKDILAGVYTGTPESRNIQMLWMVSAALSLLYRIVRIFPWYGLFLCLCHYGCFFLILRRSLRFCTGLLQKLAAALIEGLLFGGLFLEHLVYAQYTLTCTLLGATAAFLFYTTDLESEYKEFIKKNIPSVLLVFLAYLIRTEMLLLVLPMICVAGAAKWGSEKKIFTREHALKYLWVIGLILAGILAGEASNRIACSSREWRVFTEFFNNRTELYDFQAPPDFGAHEGFYESIGLTESEKVLLDNYNFGMDEEIDETVIGRIAEYAAMNQTAETPFWQNLKDSLKAYGYRFTHGPGTGADYPWNYAVILAYVLAFCAGIFPKGQTTGGQKEQTRDQKEQEGEKKALLKNTLGITWKLAFLFAVRTCLWMFILMRGRDPVRITHSLYLMELCILGAMFLVECGRISTSFMQRSCRLAALAGFGVLSLMMLPEQIRNVQQEQIRREEVNQPYQALYDYLTADERKENFYLIDVYSSVSYSEKMFAEVDNTLDNYDIMGGWACKSPLQRKKLALYGITDMEQALKDDDHVYFVRKTSEDMQWLFDYYEGHGTPVEVHKAAAVGDAFEIYSVNGK